jgi:hypothetical protein
MTKRRGLVREGDVWFWALFTWAWLLFPVLIALAVSAIKPVFNPRYFIFELVPLALVLSVAVRFVSSRVCAIALLMSVVISVAGVIGVYRRPSIADWRGATQVVVSSSTSADGIVFDPTFDRIPFQYYLDRPGAGAVTLPEPVVPGDGWGLLPLEDFAVVPAAIDNPGLVFRPGQRVWVVGSGGSEAPDVLSATQFLRSNGRQLKKVELDGVTVQLFQVPPGG